MDGRAKLPPHTNETIRRASRAEKQRVRDMLARDKADAAAERFRREAEVEFEAGKPVMMADAVVPPTREQLASGEFTTYYPKQPDGSVREVRTHRRRQVPQAYKMMLWGVIDIEGLMACQWYRDLHEKTGLAGNIPSVNYEKEIFAAYRRKVMFSDSQLDAQDEYRRIAPMIRSRHLRLLNAMVLDDLPIHRATRYARAFHRDPKPAFAAAVEQLINARDVLKKVAS